MGSLASFFVACVALPPSWLHKQLSHMGNLSHPFAAHLAEALWPPPAPLPYRQKWGQEVEARGRRRSLKTLGATTERVKEWGEGSVAGWEPEDHLLTPQKVHVVQRLPNELP